MNNYGLEDVLKWDQSRVDMHAMAINARNLEDKEQREKQQHESRYGEKPDEFSWGEWLELDDKIKEKVSNGKLSVDAVRRRLDRQERQNDS